MSKLRGITGTGSLNQPRDYFVILSIYKNIKCDLNVLADSGGTCLSRYSDVFLHCSVDTYVQLGSWTEPREEQSCGLEMGSTFLSNILY